MLGQQGLKENDSTVEASDYGHPLQNEERLQAKEKPGTLPRGQDFLKLLTMKALEALAQTPPDSHSKAAGGELGFVPCNPQFLYHFRASITFRNKIKLN